MSQTELEKVALNMLSILADATNKDINKCIEITRAMLQGLNEIKDKK